MNKMTGYMLIGIGVLFAVGGFFIGMGGAGIGVGAIMALGGWFSVYLGDADAGPLDTSAELYRYGRPANAEVLTVGESTLSPDGTRTAELEVRVSPVNESRFKSRRTVALPGGRIPTVGSTITVKFDPESRKNFVLMEQNVEVVDRVRATANALYGGLPS